MKKTEIENIVSKINLNIFFKEFTFNKNDFHVGNKKLEFADNLILLDEIFFIYQVKNREFSYQDDTKWFENKVLKKGVRQIKSTLNYLKSVQDIEIKNERGHIINISAVKDQDPQKIIIYTPGQKFPDKKRFLKFHESHSVGLIHLFHSEDYLWICKYLITPAEIKEYLQFREDFFIKHKLELNELPEQYVLGHFLETLNTDSVIPEYIENLKRIDIDNQNFDLSGLLENFSNRMIIIENETDYYHIIKEIALLNRSEMIEFKKRFILCFDKCKETSPVLPYRIYSPRTDCAFIFIPICDKKRRKWKNILDNFTYANKYDTKASRSIGVVIFKSLTDKDYEVYWELIQGPFIYDKKLEQLLKKANPLRATRTKEVFNRYKDLK